jgi:hypothetical protein
MAARRRSTRCCSVTSARAMPRRRRRRADRRADAATAIKQRIGTRCGRSITCFSVRLERARAYQVSISRRPVCSHERAREGARHRVRDADRAVRGGLPDAGRFRWCRGSSEADRIRAGRRRAGTGIAGL